MIPADTPTPIDAPAFRDAETPAELLAQLAGAASTCWTELGNAGEFKSDLCATWVSLALDRLIELGWVSP